MAGSSDSSNGGSGQSSTAPTTRISPASATRMVPSTVTAANSPFTSRPFCIGARLRSASSAALAESSVSPTGDGTLAGIPSIAAPAPTAACSAASRAPVASTRVPA